VTVDVAFIGAGGIVSKHLRQLQDSAQANVVGVCDVDEETATNWADAHDAAAYTSWEALFDDGGFAAVFVCVPPFAHEGQEVRAADEGVHLFVEKPLGLDRSYPRNVLEAVEASEIITQVGHHMRYNEAVERAVELVNERTLATIYGQWVGGVPGGADHWWRHRDRSGGQVVEQATHVFDLVRAFGGDVGHVSAEGDLRVRTDEVDFPDAVSATLHHENGLPSQVMTSCASPSSDIGVTLVGEELHLSIVGNSLHGVVDGEEIDFEGENDGHNTEVDAFVDAVAAGDPARPRSPYADAIHTFELTLAATEAVNADGHVSVSA